MYGGGADWVGEVNNGNWVSKVFGKAKTGKELVGGINWKGISEAKVDESESEIDAVVPPIEVPVELRSSWGPWAYQHRTP